MSQPDADSQTVQTQTTLISSMGSKGQQMLTYSLFKAQSMFLSATSKEGLPDAGLHAI